MKHYPYAERRGAEVASSRSRSTRFVLPILSVLILASSACVFGITWTGGDTRKELGLGTPAEILIRGGGYSANQRRNAASQWVSDAAKVIEAMEADPELAAEWAAWKAHLCKRLMETKEGD